MNKKNSIVVVVVFAFLVSFLTLGNWGEPISKLEKTTENITQLDNFETLFGFGLHCKGYDPEKIIVVKEPEEYYKNFESYFK